MKSKKIRSNSLLLIAVIVLVISVFTAWMAKDDAPRMVTPPANAVNCVEEMMDAIAKGDYRGASERMYGRPSLGSVPDEGNIAVELLWAAFLESVEYTIVSECYVKDSGVALDVSIRSLDVPMVIRDMEGYAAELLGKRVASAKDPSDVYDSDNSFRKEILDIVLRDATMKALENNQAYKEETITLQLVFEQGQWWVIPDSALQKILSGSF